MRRVTLWYLRSWLALRRTLPRTRRLLEDFKADVVVGDEEFSGMVAAGDGGLKRVFISDELELGFARTWIARKVEGRVERWYGKLQSSVDRLVVPELGEDSGNRFYVGPIVRPVTLGRDAARAEHGLPDGPMVLFSMSGSGLGLDLVRRTAEALRSAALDGAFLAVTGNRGRKLAMEGVYDLGVVSDNQNLVAAADLVVSTAGKSTIDEAAASGTPAVVIPIRYHAEQERNAASLGYRAKDVSRLQELIQSKIGRREAPRDFRGAKDASRLILSLP